MGGGDFAGSRGSLAGSFCGFGLNGFAGSFRLGLRGCGLLGFASGVVGFFGGRSGEIIREEVARKKGSLSEDGDEVGKVVAIRNGDRAAGFGALFLAGFAGVGGVVRSADGAGRGGGVL